MVGRIRAKAGANYLRAVMLRNRACLVRKCVVSLNLWRRSCIKIHTWIMCEADIVDRVWTEFEDFCNMRGVVSVAVRSERFRVRAAKSHL